MVLSIFKKSYFIQISWIIIFSILLAIPSFFQSYTLFIPKSTIFLKLICFYPWFKISWLYQFVSYLLLLAFSFYFKRFLASNLLISRHNFIPSLLVLLLFNVFHPFQYQVLSIIFIFLLTISISFLLKSSEDEIPDNNIFGAALSLSLASFLSYSAIILFPIIWISFLIFKTLKIRYLFMTLIGLAIPYIFLLTYLFWCDSLDVLFQEINNIETHYFHIYHISGLFNLAILFLLVFFTFLSLSKIISETSSKLIEIRRKTILFLWIFAFGLYTFFFYPDTISNSIIIIAFPAILGHYLIGVKKQRLWIDFIFTILLILIIINRYTYVIESFLN